MLSRRVETTGNLKSESFPAGTRFLYRMIGGTRIMEDVVLEWAPSGNFVKCMHMGWQSLEAFSILNVIETLGSNEPDMCPNCVTPWKCNGPHLSGGNS